MAGHEKVAVVALRDSCEILVDCLGGRNRSSEADLEGELVVADPDLVAVGKVRGGLDRLPLDLDTVGRPQIDDHEARSGVHDRGMVAADIGVVEDDLVVVISPNPSGGGTQLMELSGRVAQPATAESPSAAARPLILV